MLTWPNFILPPRSHLYDSMVYLEEAKTGIRFLCSTTKSVLGELYDILVALTIKSKLF